MRIVFFVVLVALAGLSAVFLLRLTQDSSLPSDFSPVPPAIVYVACSDTRGAVATYRYLESLRVPGNNVHCLLLLPGSLEDRAVREVKAQIEPGNNKDGCLKVSVIKLRSPTTTPHLVVIDYYYDRRQASFGSVEDNTEVRINGELVGKGNSGVANMVAYLKKNKPDCVVTRPFRPDQAGKHYSEDSMGDHWLPFEEHLDSILASCYPVGEGCSWVSIRRFSPYREEFVAGVGE